MGIHDTAPIDQHARHLGDRVLAEDLSNEDAASLLVSYAVRHGDARRAVIWAHHGAMLSTDDDEFIDCAVHLMVTYVLPREGRPSPVDVSRFACGESAQGWLRHLARCIRSTRIHREIGRRHREEPLSDHDRAVADVDHPSMEAVYELREASGKVPRAGQSIVLLHASVLHRLFDGPALQSWCLTTTERTRLRDVLDRDPRLPYRVLKAGSSETGDDAELVRLMWSSWCEEGVRDVLAKSTADRDVVGLLTKAAVVPLPRPGKSTGAMSSIRAKLRSALPQVDRSLLMTTLDAFIAAYVAPVSEKDYTRRPLDPEEALRRQMLAPAFPNLIREVARSSGVAPEDLLSGLIDLFLAPIPAVSSEAFTPTGWRL